MDRVAEDFLHQTRPKLKRLPFPGRSESTPEPVDGHLVMEFTTLGLNFCRLLEASPLEEVH